MENSFKRSPEYTDFYRNLSSHSSKSYEDPALFQLMRSLVGLYKANGGCKNITLPSENQAREMLKLTYEDKKIVVKLNNTIIGSFESSLGGLSLNLDYEAKILPGQSEANCYNCKCLNMEVIKADITFKWNYTTWITIIATIASLGFVASAASIFYFVGKSCLEVMEASQNTTIVLLMAIMFAYTSIIPFGFEPNDLICHLRSVASRLAFVFILSVLLSRSLMLATADTDGLPGHISGIVQFTLMVLMAGIQVIYLIYIPGNYGWYLWYILGEA